MTDPIRSPVVLALVALLLLLLGYATSIAVRTGLADLHAEPAKDFLETKRNAGEVLTQDEWQAIHDTLSQALILAPGNPENISELGRLYRIRLEPDDLDAAQITSYGDSATAFYQTAIARRPTWPWDWSDMARVKYEQYQDAGDVFQEALVRAVEFGPREDPLLDQIAWLGMNTWSVLRPAAARAVLTAADRVLAADAGALDWMFEDPGHWRLPCAGVGEPYIHVRHRCESLGLT